MSFVTISRCFERGGYVLEAKDGMYDEDDMEEISKISGIDIEKREGDLYVYFKSEQGEMIDNAIMSSCPCTKTFDGEYCVEHDECIEESRSETNVPDPYICAKSYVSEGNSCFITGPSGTGKNHLVWEMIVEMCTKQKNKTIAVLSMTRTGVLNMKNTMPSILLKHCHVHYFYEYFGFSEKMAECVRCDSLDSVSGAWKAHAVKNRERWCVDVMVIDEISSIEAELLDIFHKTMKSAVINGDPQMIFIGDFFQAYPYDTRERANRLSTNRVPKRSVEYAFRARCWKEWIGSRVCNLNRDHYHDAPLQDMLMHLRDGTVSGDDVDILKSRRSTSGCVILDDTYLRVFLRKSKASDYNKQIYDTLIDKGNAHKLFKSKIINIIFKRKTSPLDITKGYEKYINLKTHVDRHLNDIDIVVGMYVFSSQIIPGIPIGTRGKVINVEENKINVKFEINEETFIETEVTYCSEKFTFFEFGSNSKKKEYEYTIESIPLYAGNATTVYECMGRTFPKIYVSFSEDASKNEFRGTPQCKQLSIIYSLISRVSSIDNIVINGIGNYLLEYIPNNTVREYYAHISPTGVSAQHRPGMTSARGCVDPLKTEVIITRVPMSVVFERYNILKRTMIENDVEKTRTGINKVQNSIDQINRKKRNKRITPTSTPENPAKKSKPMKTQLCDEMEYLY